MSQIRFVPGRIAQIAYVVPDIERALEEQSRDLNLGAWCLFSNFQFETLRYRDSPGACAMNVAICFSGDLMYELIEQTNDAPSVYQDVIRDQGFGFHHYGFMVDSLDESIARYEKRGYEIAQYSETSNGIRAAYMDARGRVPGMIELLEISDAVTEIFDPIYQAGRAWDGVTPAITRYG